MLNLLLMIMILNFTEFGNNREVIKLLLKMIDGVYPSQFSSVEAMRSSHYRQLKSILNSTSSPKMSWLSPDISNISSRKKYNHRNWVIFNKNQQERNLCRQNTGIYQRLIRISSERSRYAIKTENSISKDHLLHHNYLYECSRRYEKVQEGNKIIVSKLNNAKGEIDHKKHEKQFRINQRNVSRLEKFQRFKRLNRVVTKNMRDKFAATSFNQTFSLTNPEKL